MNKAITTGFALAVVCSAAALGVWPQICAAQTAVGGKGAVVGTGAVTGFVENMDRSLAFYHEVFGMDVPPLPASGERPYNPSNAQLFAMFDIRGAKERHQHARVPGTDIGFELMEVQNVIHRTIPLRLQDPGAMTLVFSVADINSVLASARRANAEIVTAGGKALALADGSLAAMIKDLDGRFIELRESGHQSDSSIEAISPVTGLRLSIAVADLDTTIEIYRDVLGFRLEDEQILGADHRLQALTALPTAEFRRGVMRGPGASMWIEFVEYRGVDRHPLDMRIQDRGAARLQLRAENLEALVGRMRAAGLVVVSEGGGPVPIPPNFMGALVADPNNFFLTPFAPCDGCAPGLISETD